MLKLSVVSVLLIVSIGFGQDFSHRAKGFYHNRQTGSQIHRNSGQNAVKRPASVHKRSKSGYSYSHRRPNVSNYIYSSRSSSRAYAEAQRQYWQAMQSAQKRIAQIEEAQLKAELRKRERRTQRFAQREASRESKLIERLSEGVVVNGAPQVLSELLVGSEMMGHQIESFSNRNFHPAYGFDRDRHSTYFRGGNVISLVKFMRNNHLKAVEGSEAAKILAQSARMANEVARDRKANSDGYHRRN